MRAAWLAVLVSAASALGVSAQSPPNEQPITRIAFGSCNREYRPQILWPAILANQPQLWIWLGDIVYGRADVPGDLARRYDSEKKMPGYQALLHQARVIGMWDDNDYGAKDGGAVNPNKEESQRLLLNFLDEPADSPRRKQAGIYTSYTFGPPGRQVKIILLDTRYFREEPPHFWSGFFGKAAPAPAILGEEQWQWLEQQLTHTTADIHFICSGYQVIAEEQPFEKWNEIPRARQRLFDLLAKTQPRNPIILSGDRHLGEISRAVDPRLPQPIYDITSSGMTHHATNNILFNFDQEPNRFRVGHNYVTYNFGFIEINWGASPPVVTLQVRGQENNIAVAANVTLASGATAP